MVTAVSYGEAVGRRRMVSSAGNGEKHWRSDYMGRRAEASAQPEAFLIEMTAGETLLPHFHAVDQFQVFVEGGGMLGRQTVGPLTVHYADHHTAYGPIVASASGFSYFTFRPVTDPGAVYLNKPGYRDAMRPSAKRHATDADIVLSTGPVLASRESLAVDSLLEGLGAAGDGVGASLIRMGPEMAAKVADPAGTGGQYCLVVNGSLEQPEGALPRWSVMHAAPGEAPLELRAGIQGAEVLVLGFSRRG